MSLAGQQLNNRYQLIRLLCSGGMGDVYLAEDSQNQRQVAIKVIRAETPCGGNDAVEEEKRLFRREAKAVARLSHPRILSLYDHGEEQFNNLTLFYLVMPYCPERSFADWLRGRGGTDQLSPRDVVHVVQQAAEALQYAHEHQVIHQDIKPSNFLVQACAEGSTCPDLVLSDFGVARLSSATSSASQSIRGTPTYMPPEQWEGNPVYATDQYGLAVIAYELLTGRPPFQGNPTRMMYQHLNTPPPPPTSLNPALSSQVDLVLLHALEKRPERRFPSVVAFSEAFAQAVQGTPAAAPTEPFTGFERPKQVTGLHVTAGMNIPPSRPKGKSKRRSLLTAAVALLSVLIIGSVAFAQWLNQNASAALVTITPQSKVENHTYTISEVAGVPDASKQQVGGIRRVSATQTDTQTADATGQGTTPGTHATGELKIKNPYPTPLVLDAGTVLPNQSGSSSPDIQVTLDTAITVPPAVIQIFYASTADVNVHVVQIGTIGNVSKFHYCNNCNPN